MQYKNLAKIALALDLETEAQIINLLNSLNPKPAVLKIGLELIAALGIEKTMQLTNTLTPESQIFLDFKLHDIPNTVSRTLQTLKKYSKLKYVTVHALGGQEMLQTALQTVAGQFELVGVTVLTSHDRSQLKQELGLDLGQLSDHLSQTAKQAGIKWLVASSWECAKLKQKYSNFRIITPGIRLLGSNNQDQKRIATPENALSNGSDLLVIGRPIYQAENPQAVWQKLISI